ncbi:MAG: succinate dehydrogenase, hydrophobic membrane anchor protein [Rhodospirillaceae bacterium]|nr:MAG: succinate dehydrogenase, hydrophobic membrane anchor protein [Rhodospirillaceae bacterium]
MFKSTNLRSPLGRARGLGTAKEGLHHWWAQRVTAVALVPLSLWFVVSLIRLAHGENGGFYDWLLSPINATALILFIAVGFHHGVLGLQVVIEDYVGDHGRRTVLIMLTKLVGYALAALAIVSTLIVSLGG